MESIAKILLTTIVIMFSSCQVLDTSKAKPIERSITYQKPREVKMVMVQQANKI